MSAVDVVAVLVSAYGVFFVVLTVLVARAVWLEGCYYREAERAEREVDMLNDLLAVAERPHERVERRYRA